MGTKKSDKVLLARKLLYHRFGLIEPLHHVADAASIENLDFDAALEAFKESYKIFISNKENQQKMISSILTKFQNKYLHISDNDVLILIHKMSQKLLALNRDTFLNDLELQLSNRELILLPIKTYLESPKQVPKEYIKTIALFDDRLVKINRRGIEKPASLRIYRTHKFPISELKEELQNLMHSFVEPLPLSIWDKTLNACLKAEKINLIIKKEQLLGNSSWVTVKLLLYVTVYASLFRYAELNHFNEFDSEPISLKIAEEIYKLFTIDDRNRSVQAYLALYDSAYTDQISNVPERIQSIKKVLENLKSKKTSLDKPMLQAIYIKSLNWLLADYLKKGDIGAARDLVALEKQNTEWNPLIYAAQNGKTAIAELLGSDAAWMNLKDVYGNLAIHYAIINGYDSIFQIFLRYKTKNNLNLWTPDGEGNLPIHLAAIHNRVDILELLLKNDIGLLNAQNEQHNTALKLACEYQHSAVIRRLLAKGATLEGIDPKEYSEEIQLLLEKRKPSPGTMGR